MENSLWANGQLSEVHSWGWQVQAQWEAPKSPGAPENGWFTYRLKVQLWTTRNLLLQRNQFKNQQSKWFKCNQSQVVVPCLCRKRLQLQIALSCHHQAMRILSRTERWCSPQEAASSNYERQQQDPGTKYLLPFVLRGWETVEMSPILTKVITNYF